MDLVPRTHLLLALGEGSESASFVGPLTEAHLPGLQSGPSSPGRGATVTHFPAKVGGACEFSEMTDEAARHLPAS